MSLASDNMDYRTLLANAYVELKQSRDELEAFELAEHEPIAIIGIGCRFPGGVNSPESYWRLLIEGEDAIREIPQDRWDVEKFYDADRDRAGKMYTRHGGFLDEVDRFDAAFFGISPREAEELDPQHRLLLEVSWEALEDAGETPSELPKTGVFVGLFMGDYAQLGFNSGDAARINAYNCTGNLRAMAAGRISYTFGFHGPALQLDTACSSSLLAIHLACQSLRLRESDRALAGGVNLILTPDATIGVCRLGALSTDGRCKTFSSRADGYGRGEGCGVVVLKRLSDAIADGDRVLALIRGSAVNHDGRSNGLTAPNGNAQEFVIRAALANARVKPEQIQYVEAHGTGTLLGDPIEALALGSVLGEGRAKSSPVILGSVKTNFGHLEAAAGVAGLIKTVLALKARTIPPHLHLGEPNPHIPWDSLPLVVPTEKMPWVSENGTRFAGVSAFGMSGTNAHVVLEEAPRRLAVSNEVERPRHMLCLSARSERALEELTGRYEDYLAAGPDVDLGDICYTASAGRRHFNYRVAIQARSNEELLERLRSHREGLETAGVACGVVTGASQPKIAFLFTGQGSQYTGMGRELYRTQPVFRETLERCQEILSGYLDRSLLSVMFAEDDATAALLDETEYTQPALFALEYSLARMWQAWGVRPAMLLGHSVGEYVAACIAGIFSLEDALRLIATRGRLMQSLPRDGAMATVFAEPSRIKEVLDRHGNEVAIAAINGPANTVISGRMRVVDEVCRELDERQIKSKPLRVSHAFHSSLMEPMLDEFRTEAEKITYGTAQIPIISNLTGQEEELGAEYWIRQARETVRYANGVKRLVMDGVTGCLEVGPKPVLTRMASDNGDVRRRGIEMWSTLDGKHEEWAVVLATLGRMYTSGVGIDWKGYEKGYQRRRVGLPGYPFERQRYWVGSENRRERVADGLGGDWAKEHELAGSRVREAWTKEIRYEGELSADRPAYLGDHRVFGEAVLPGAAYLEMMQWVISKGLNSRQVELEGATFRRALVLKKGERKRLQVVMKPEGEGQYALRVYSEPEEEGDGEKGPWVLHASGRGKRAEGNTGKEWQSLEEVKRRCTEVMSVRELYEIYEGLGPEYGEHFRPITQLWRGEGESLAELRMPRGIDAAGYRLHPVLLDGCLQTLGAMFGTKETGGQTYLPVGMKHLQVFSKPGETVWVHATFTEGGSADFTLYNGDGVVAAAGTGLELLPAGPEALSSRAKAPITDTIYRIEWEVREGSIAKEKTSSRGLWLILGDDAGVGRQLATRLREKGELVRLVHDGQQFQKAESGDFIIDPLSSDNFDSLLRSVVEPQTPLRGVVHLWSLDAAPPPELTTEALRESSRRGCESALNLVQALTRASQTPRLWLATCQTQAVRPGDPLTGLAQTPLWGMGKAIAAEHPEFRCSLIDLFGRETGDDADSLFHELWSGEEEPLIAYREGTRRVPHLSRSDVDHRSTDALSIPDKAYALQAGSRRELAGLRLASISRKSVRSGEIEIEVRAAGLNFRDVLNAMGLYPGNAGALGGECAGVVVAVASDVEQFCVGDEVIVMTLGSFSRYVTVDARLTVKKPRGLTFEAAAALPVAFLTAYYALHDLARLSAGERVLIHAAAGGVGMAAIQIAKMIGAEIYATASPAKWDTLRALGVNTIYNSRNLDFADQILQATEGRGVDVVLNSLSGDFIERSLVAMSGRGRFVEIGKRGVWSAEQIAEVSPA
ncbi:MAG: beta-ketoacyl synthase N-terminal-like domain-containing protein, partial [Acidobacteriota bacterium]